MAEKCVLCFPGWGGGNTVWHIGGNTMWYIYVMGKVEVSGDYFGNGLYTQADESESL